MKIELPKVMRRLPPLFVNVEHYFSWCDIQEKQWRDRVHRNPKTVAVDLKLARWRRENPDHAIVNMAEWRFERIRRNARKAI